MDPVNAPAKFEVRTSPVPEITAIGVLVKGCSALTLEDRNADGRVYTDE